MCLILEVLQYIVLRQYFTVMVMLIFLTFLQSAANGEKSDKKHDEKDGEKSDPDIKVEELLQNIRKAEVSENIKGGTKWLTCCRQNFQMDFLQWKYLSFEFFFIDHHS